MSYQEKEDRKSGRSKEIIDYRALHEGSRLQTSAEGSSKLTMAETTSTAPSASGGEISTGAPAEETSAVDEKKNLQAHLAALDEKQKRLQERKELEILRQQIVERENYVSELERSLTESGKTKSTGSTPARKSSDTATGKGATAETEQLSGEASPKTKKSGKGKSKEVKATGTTSEEGIHISINIDTLRKMNGLRKLAKKELAKLGICSSESSCSKFTSSSDSSSDSTSQLV